MLPEALLQKLADGREHSWSDLCEALGLGADELSEALRQLEASGLEVVATEDNRRLEPAIDWLASEAIAETLTSDSRARIDSLECFLELESTNRFLLAQSTPSGGKARVAIAEFQSAGRGRRGRSWSMPPGSGIALSLAWRFEQAPDHLAALSLAVGTAAKRAIADTTGLDIGLKWPNDLIVDEGKLGGILVELDKPPNGGCHVVAGIGVNVRVPLGYLEAVSDYDHGARDLSGTVPSWPVDRNVLAGALIERFIELFSGFAATGFEPYRAEWVAADVLHGQLVEIDSATEKTYGTVCGIDADGALVMKDESGVRRNVISGDVTIRSRSDAGDRLR